MSTKLSRCCIAGTILIVAGLSPSPAWAQETPEGKEAPEQQDPDAPVPSGEAGPAANPQEPRTGAAEIIVTARRRAERLVDVPVASSAFGEQLLRDENIDQLSELLQKTPSATFANLGASFSAEVMIRGVGGGRQLNAETAIGQYRNGAFVAGGNIGGRNFNRMDFFDVERVEVLRGPQGALYGRNAVGGAINIISNRPASTLGGEFVAAVGSNERFEVQAIGNLPLSDSAALRVGLLTTQQRDGDFRNADGRTLDDERFTGGRIGLRLTPAAGFDATFTVDYFEERGPSFAVFSYNQAADPNNRFVRNLTTPSTFERDELTAILEMNLSLGFGRLTSVTFHKRRDAATDDDFDAFNGITNPLLRDYRRTSVDDFKRFGQEVRVASEGGGPLTWLVGAEYLTLADTLDNVLSGAQGAARAQNNRARTVSDDHSTSVFGLLGYDLTPALNLTGEVRATWDSKRIDLLSTVFSPAGVPTDRLFSFKRDFENISPVASLTWKPQRDTSLYLRYATGYRAGGFNNEPDVIAPARYSISYEPEETVAYEVGAKTLLLNRRLYMAAAAYLMETDNLLVNSAFSVTAGGATRNISVLENGGSSEQYGIEFEASGRAIASATQGNLDLRFTVSRAWGEIKKGRFAGNDVPRLREWQGSASATYRRPLGGGLDLFLNYAFRGEYGGVQNTNLFTLDDTYYHDARFGLEGKRWSLVASVENLADDTFDGDKSLPDAATGRFRQVYTTRPRSFMVRSRLEF